MKSKTKNYLLYFLMLVYVSGSIGFTLNPDFFSPFTPFTLLFTSFVFLIFQPLKETKFLSSFLAIAFLGYLAEVIGVKTGLIFGNYTYGNSLGIKLLEVPLVISINWALLICSSIIIVRKFLTIKWLVLLVASLLITLIDLLIEQVAVKLDFWAFSNGLPGIHNYIGWIAVAFISPLFFYENIIKGSFKVSLIILILQIIFFTTLYLFY
jgi:bisanhydrobacterioruberin hydratase